MKHLISLLAIATAMVSQAQLLYADFESSASDISYAASESAFKWGYSEGNTFSGLGTQKTGTFSAALKVPGSGYLKGGKVVSVNLPVVYAGMTDVTVWGRKNLTTSENLFSISLENGSFQSGYNEITLPEAYTITGDFFVGYTFTITSVVSQEAKMPIGVAQGQAANSLFLKLDANSAFQDYSSAGYGMLALQLFIEDLHFVDYGAQFALDETINTLPSSNCSLELDVVSTGKNPISRIEYVTEINGQSETHTANVNISAGIGNSAKTRISFESPAETGPYNVELWITRINGHDNEGPTHTILWGDNITRKAPHKVLVEELTGTGCGWCPRGWVGMEAIKKQMSDVAVPIAVHQYNSTDPMFIANYAVLPVEGAPSAVIDRVLTIDPYYGSDNETPFGIQNDVTANTDFISAIDIHHLTGLYDEDKTQVEAKVDLEFLGSLGCYSIEFVLTADSLSGTSSSWRQTNYYYQYSPIQRGIVESLEPELASFCKGGTNGKSQVFLTFNDVAISTSYNSDGLNTAPELPLDFQAGEQISVEHTLSLPTKSVIKNAIKSNLVFLNALVFDENGRCVNAARSRVYTQEELEGIETIANDPLSSATRRYNLAGQPISNDYKGFSIVNGRKQIVCK